MKGRQRKCDTNFKEKQILNEEIEEKDKSEVKGGLHHSY